MSLESDVKSVEFLLNHGANTELKDCDGRTALHVAAWQGYTDIVKVRGIQLVSILIYFIWHYSLKN